MFIAVYLPPQTNACTKIALNELHKAIRKQDSSHPGAALLVARDFNTGKFKSVFTSFLPLCLWQGLKTITDYKGKPSRELPSDASLPDELNVFRASNTKACMRAPAVPADCVITLSIAGVSKTFFKQVNIHKAAGPYGLPGRALKACADQLASVVTDIFNLSLTESVMSTCFKQTTIAPGPKKAKLTSLNDYRPVSTHVYSHEVL